MEQMNQKGQGMKKGRVSMDVKEAGKKGGQKVRELVREGKNIIRDREERKGSVGKGEMGMGMGNDDTMEENR